MSSALDTNELTELANKLGPEEFAHRFPHLFLVFYETIDTVGVSSFATQVISKDAARGRPTSQMRAVPLIKAPNNPYSDRISLGRARNCDVVLRNPSVSKLHAHIRKEPKRYLGGHRRQLTQRHYHRRHAGNGRSDDSHQDRRADYVRRHDRPHRHRDDGPPSPARSASVGQPLTPPPLHLRFKLRP
jgi:hypothetical protein